MGLLNIFSGKAPEDYEQKGDALFEANAYGKAVVEYQRALDRLGKTSPSNDGYRQNLQDKIRTSKENLALEHQQTAENLMAAGHDYDARQYIELALELTEDMELKNALEKQLQTGEVPETEDIVDDAVEVEIQDYEPDYEDEPVEDLPEIDEDDEHLAALVGTLPDDVQDIYLGYGEDFKSGYLALNRGDFETAAEHLAAAMEVHPDPAGYIALELATARLNLGKYDEARRLLEAFLEHHPDALPAYQLLCEVYWETKAFDHAEELLATLPPDLEESVAGYLLRGETLFQAEKYADARSFYRGFLKKYEWNESIARGLAKTHEALGEMANARNIYSEIMAQCSSCHARIDPYIKQKFADLSFASGLNTTAVLELYLSLASELPQNAAEYYQKISRIYSIQGNLEEARRFQQISEKYENKDAV
ncbi:MAG: tetratricopeptide repeat protein [Desulfobacterales bacterium]|jgi:tetratricopeptide (TPR) repeat protein